MRSFLHVLHNPVLARKKQVDRRRKNNCRVSKNRLKRNSFDGHRHIGFTTDVIVGFSTETEDLFEESCAFVELCAFSDIHVFPYSSRRGTLASRKYAPLPKDVVASRVAKLLDIKHKLRNAFFIKNSGQTAPVYFEEKKEALCVGYTPNYIKVYADAQCGDIIDVKLTELYDDGMLGVPTDSQ